jgi:hypothetical protein
MDLTAMPQDLENCKAAIIDEYSESEDLSSVSKVIFFTTETIPLNSDWSSEINRLTGKFNCKTEQLYFIAGGTELTNGGESIPCPIGPNRVFIFNYFFNQVVINNTLDKINFNYSTVRPKLFDCLLGGRKPHRIFIYNRLIDNGLLEKSIVNLNEGSPWEKNYFNELEIHKKVLVGPGYTSIDNLPVYSSPELSQWEIPVVASFKAQTSNKFYSAEITREQTNRYGHHPQISSLVPKEIYNHSYYSIVAETGGELSHFMSEKVAKPIFAKRIFILFGSAGLLQCLKDMGFRTFSDLIDESYDLESNNLTRYTMAWEQCLKLASLDPSEAYNKLHDILAYNQHHLLNINSKLDKLKEFITKPSTC